MRRKRSLDPLISPIIDKNVHVDSPKNEVQSKYYNSNKYQKTAERVLKSNRVNLVA